MLKEGLGDALGVTGIICIGYLFFKEGYYHASEVVELVTDDGSVGLVMAGSTLDRAPIMMPAQHAGSRQLAKARVEDCMGCDPCRWRRSVFFKP